MRKLSLLSLVLLCLSLSCSNSGSSSGGSGGQVGTISNMSLGQNRALLGEGGGVVRTIITFEYVGSSGDLGTSVFYYDGNGNPIYGTAPPIRGLSGFRGTLNAYIDVPTGERKTITIYVYLTDGRGGTSNWLSAPFEVR